jgi:hypothetical protein
MYKSNVIKSPNDFVIKRLRKRYSFPLTCMLRKSGHFEMVEDGLTFTVWK